MIAAIYKGIGNMVVEDVPTPSIQDGELLVKVKVCAICGGDLRTFHHGHAAIKPPIILGHEFAGEIVAVGAGVDRYAVGDRVIVAPRYWLWSLFVLFIWQSASVLSSADAGPSISWRVCRICAHSGDCSPGGEC